VTFVLTLHNFDLGKSLSVFGKTDDGGTISCSTPVKGTFAWHIERFVFCVENLAGCLLPWIASVVVFMSQIFIILLNLNGIDTSCVSTCLIVEGETTHAVSAIPLEFFVLQCFQETKLLDLIRVFWQPSKLCTRSLRVDRQALFTVLFIVFVWVLPFDFQIFEVNGRVGHITVPAVVEMFAFLRCLTLLKRRPELLTSRQIRMLLLLEAEVTSITIVVVVTGFTVNSSNTFLYIVLCILFLTSHRFALSRISAVSASEQIVHQ